MVLFLFFRALLLITALYSGFFLLWRIFEREHVDDIHDYMDAVFASACVAFILGKLPSFVFGGFPSTAYGFVRLFSGEFSMVFGILCFFCLLFLFLKRKRKDLFGLYDLSVVPLTLMLSIFTLSDALGIFVPQKDGARVSYGIAALYLFLSIIYLGASRLLLYFEKNYRTYFWYRYRRNSALTGFVTAVFSMVFGIVTLIQSLTLLPFAIISFGGFSLALSLVWILGGFVILYVRSGRLR